MINGLFVTDQIIFLLSCWLKKFDTKLLLLHGHMMKKPSFGLGLLGRWGRAEEPRAQGA